MLNLNEVNQEVLNSLYDTKIVCVRCPGVNPASDSQISAMILGYLMARFVVPDEMVICATRFQDCTKAVLSIEGCE